MRLGEAAGIVDGEPFITADYWVEKIPDKDEVILEKEELTNYNQAIAAKSPSVYQLENYPEEISGNEVRALLSDNNPLSDSAYLNGALLTTEQRAAMMEERNIAGILPNVDVKFGITVRHTNLRALPFSQGIFGTPGDTNFDLLQETTLDMGETVAILHQSLSGSYYFVQARNYRGWVHSADIGITERLFWEDYVNPAKFIVVTARNLYIDLPEERLLCQMGTRISMLTKQSDGYRLLVPRRDVNGKLYEAEIMLEPEADVSVGYLPYTRANIIQEAFKFYGAPYGWGGLKESEDCSGFIADIYKTVGVMLPRNADEQETTAGIWHDFAGMSTKQRQLFMLGNIEAGDGIYMNGHGMLYLGTVDSEPYVIHILGSHTVHYSDGTAEKVRVMRTVVSDLNLKNSQNRLYTDIIRRAVAFK